MNLPPPFAVLSDGVLTLHCLREGDAAAHLAGEDVDQVRWLTEGHESTPARVAEWIRENQVEWRTGGPRRHFGVYAGTDARLVGGVETNSALLAGAPADVNVSYAVFPDQRGRGFAARALTLVCDWLGETTAAERAVVRVAPGNVHSRRVPPAAGFTEIGLVEDHEGCFVHYERVLRS